MFDQWGNENVQCNRCTVLYSRTPQGETVDASAKYREKVSDFLFEIKGNKKFQTLSFEVNANITIGFLLMILGKDKKSKSFAAKPKAKEKEAQFQSQTMQMNS